MHGKIITGNENWEEVSPLLRKCRMLVLRVYQPYEHGMDRWSDTRNGRFHAKGAAAGV